MLEINDYVDCGCLMFGCLEVGIVYSYLMTIVATVINRLRGTILGANNRLDLLSLVTSGVNDTEASESSDDVLGVVEGWQENETHNPDVPATSHRRGLSPFVFVPLEEVVIQDFIIFTLKIFVFLHTCFSS